MSGLARIEPDGRALAGAIDPAEYARLLGVPRTRTLEGAVAERAAAARAWYAAHGRPWAGARRVGIARIGADTIALETGHAFRSQALSERLRSGGASGLVALAVSAGPEVDAESQRHWEQGRPDEGYFLDRFGAAVAEHLVFWATVWVCRESEMDGETVLAHLSPGCGDWDLEEQAKLMGLIAGGADGIGPLRMLPSGMMTPKSSVLAVRGLTRRKVEPSPTDACRSCDLSPCAFRRAPYRGAG